MGLARLGLAFNHAYAKSLEIGTHSLCRHPSEAAEPSHTRMLIIWSRLRLHAAAVVVVLGDVAAAAAISVPKTSVASIFFARPSESQCSVIRQVSQKMSIFVEKNVANVATKVIRGTFSKFFQLMLENV